MNLGLFGNTETISDTQKEEFIESITCKDGSFRFTNTQVKSQHQLDLRLFLDLYSSKTLKDKDFLYVKSKNLIVMRMAKEDKNRII